MAGWTRAPDRTVTGVSPVRGRGGASMVSAAGDTSRPDRAPIAPSCADLTHPTACPAVEQQHTRAGHRPGYPAAGHPHGRSAPVGGRHPGTAGLRSPCVVLFVSCHDRALPVIVTSPIMGRFAGLGAGKEPPPGPGPLSKRPLPVSEGEARFGRGHPPRSSRGEDVHAGPSLPPGPAPSTLM